MSNTKLEDLGFFSPSNVGGRMDIYGGFVRSRQHVTGKIDSGMTTNS